MGTRLEHWSIKSIRHALEMGRYEEYSEAELLAELERRSAQNHQERACKLKDFGPLFGPRTDAPAQ